MKINIKSTTTVALTAGLICLLVFSKSLFFEFVNWDDPDYVIYNQAIRNLDWDFFVWAFTAPDMGWLMPLTWISFAVDYQIWGLNPLGYHLTNVTLHAANTCLVVLIADRLLKKNSALVEILPEQRNYYPWTLLLAGILWSIHPLRVESVAWVTERKDVLNGFFSLGSILFYLRYAGARDSAGQRRSIMVYYLTSLVLLLFSILAKPVSVAIPAMLLVADWYPLGRLQTAGVRSVLIEKLPFIALSVVMIVVTIHAAASESLLVSYLSLSLFERVVIAGNGLFEYLKMSVYPVGIIHYYILPQVLPVKYYVNAALALAATVCAAGLIRKKPLLPAMWLAFTLPLLPVLGFFQNGQQAYAARFTYLAAVAPSIAAAAAIAAICGKFITGVSRASRTLFVCAIVVAILTLTVLTERLLETWRNPEVLWSKLIAVNPVGRAYYYRADYYLLKERFSEAADDLAIAIRMGHGAGYQEVFNLHAFRGYALYREKRYEEAIQEFTAAINLVPYNTYYYHRGLALAAMGRLKEAEEDFAMAGGETGPIQWHDHEE